MPTFAKGDNLYTDSVIALNPDNGELQWHFQFTPHDEWDWDAVQIPVLVDREYKGRQRKLMLWGNRNGFFYVLDRETGEFLLGEAFCPPKLGERTRRKRAPYQDPRNGSEQQGYEDLSQRSGRHKLVLTYL